MTLLVVLFGCSSDSKVSTDKIEKKAEKKEVWREQFQQAKLAEFSGNYAAAEDKYNKLLKVLTKDKSNLLTVGEIKARLAKMYMVQGHLETALPLAEETYEIAKTVKNDKSREYSEFLVLMDDISELIHDTVDGHMDNYPSYLILSDKLQKISHSGVHKNAILTQIKVANYYTSEKQYEKAKPFYDEAVRIYLHDDISQIRGATMQMISLYRTTLNNGYKKEATKVYNAISTKLKSVYNDRADAIFNKLLGRMYYNSKKYNLALKHYRKSIKEQSKFKDPHLRAETLTFMAHTMEAKGKIKNADKLFAKALEIQRNEPGAANKHLVKRLDEYQKFLKRNGQFNKAKKLNAEAQSYREKYIRF